MQTLLKKIEFGKRGKKTKKRARRKETNKYLIHSHPQPRRNACPSHNSYVHHLSSHHTSLSPASSVLFTTQSISALQPSPEKNHKNNFSILHNPTAEKNPSSHKRNTSNSFSLPSYPFPNKALSSVISFAFFGISFILYSGITIQNKKKNLQSFVWLKTLASLISRVGF